VSHLVARDLVCCFFEVKLAGIALSLSQALRVASSLFLYLEDVLHTIKRKRLNLPAREELEAMTEVCCFRILQMLLSAVHLPWKASYSVKSLMSYFLRCKVFCLTDSGATQFGVHSVVEDEMANSDQPEGKLLVKPPHL
jgi:hypothetical protein